MIPCTVLPVSRLHDIAEKTACSQMKGDINRYVLSNDRPLCGIGEPRYVQNSTGYHILRIGYCTENYLYSKRSYGCHLSFEICPSF